MTSEIKFYAHVKEDLLKVVGVSANSVPEEGHITIELPYDLGHAFMVGTENILSYSAVQLKDESYALLQKKNEHVELINRLDVIQTVVEVTSKSEKTPIVWFDIGDGYVDVEYNGEYVQNLARPLKFYFTKFDDSSYLKGTFNLDVNTLSNAAYQNQLKGWPNPIRVAVDDSSDLSIFGIKGQPAVIRSTYVKDRSK